MSRIVNLCMSGGRSSAYLAERVLHAQSALGFFRDHKFVITFANTGREHEATLDFVNNCDLRWRELYGNKVVWLEAVTNEGRKPCSFRIVSYNNASRNGEPFEAVVAKYGLPNSQFLHCTRELKENPILAYMETLDCKKGHIKNKTLTPATYETWIGIRSDEPSRLGGNRNGKQRKVYPLADDIVGGLDLSCDKADVLDFWEGMPFDLDIPEHLGNCIDCHKKSFNKLFKCIRDLGESAFHFTSYLDSQYGLVKAQNVDGKVIPRKRFRGYNNTSELIAMFKGSEFNTACYDEENGWCSESCEPFMDDNKPAKHKQTEIE